MPKTSKEGERGGGGEKPGLTGRERAILGKETEERFLQIMETMRQKGRWPSWLKKIQPSTNIEDRFGADFFAHLEVPWGREEVVLQIKRSKTGIKRAKQQERKGERPNRWEHVKMEVHPEQSETDIFDRTVGALSKERERILANPPPAPPPLPRFITDPPTRQNKSDE